MNSKHIDEVRSFNRFYTDVIGLLDQSILESRYSLPEARILFELNHHKRITASDIMALFSIDKGYLSRVLHHFEKNKMILKKRSEADARVTYISLTPKGKREFETLNRASHEQVRKLLEPLSLKDRDSLVGHMAAVTKILNQAREEKSQI